MLSECSDWFKAIAFWGQVSSPFLRCVGTAHGCFLWLMPLQSAERNWREEVMCNQDPVLSSSSCSLFCSSLLVIVPLEWKSSCLWVSCVAQSGRFIASGTDKDTLLAAPSAGRRRRVASLLFVPLIVRSRGAITPWEFEPEKRLPSRPGVTIRTAWGFRRWPTCFFALKWLCLKHWSQWGF